MKRQKLIFTLIILIFIIVIFNIKFLNEKETSVKDEVSSESDIYDLNDGSKIRLNKILIRFNGQEKDGLTSNSILNEKNKPEDYENNVKFREYFENDAKELVKDNYGIENIGFYWFGLINGATVDMSYKPNLDNGLKKKYLDELKEELESKWYTDDVSYNGIIYLTGEENKVKVSYAEVDPGVEKLLENNTEVGVLVSLRGDLISNHSNSIKDPVERERYLKDIMEQVDEIQSRVIPYLTEDEFIVRNKFELSAGFYGSITKKGLEKLRNNPNVERIYREEETHASSGVTIKDEMQLKVIDSYDINSLNSLTSDGEFIWGLAGYGSKGADTKKRIVKINKNNGNIEAECSIGFEGKGIVYANESLFVNVLRDYSDPPQSLYKINPEKCVSEDSCNKDNGCILKDYNLTDAWDVWGLTTDGDYLYTFLKKGIGVYKLAKYNFDGEFIGETEIEERVLDIVWDGNSFWTINSYAYGCAGFCEPQQNHYDVRRYTKYWNEIFHQRFEIQTPVWYGLAWDGKNIWIADGYNDKVTKLEMIYQCPEIKHIDCMPIVQPDRIKYCSGDYYNWIQSNCNVDFTY